MTVRRIVIWNFLVLFLSAVGSSLFFRWEVTLGVILGGLISSINFLALGRIGQQALGQGQSMTRLFVKVMLKLLILFGVIAGVLIYVPVDIIAFLVGVSIPVMTIGIGGLLGGARSTSVTESTDA